MLPFSGLEHSISMLGDIVLFTYDELIIVITMMSEEYKNNITCNGISCSAYKYNHRYLRLYAL